MSEKPNYLHSENRIFVLFFGLSTLWAALLGFQLGLTDQEAYYWIWSRVPAWNYYEHPPLQAWVTALSTKMFNSDPFFIRWVCFLWGRFIGFYFFYKWVSQRWSQDLAPAASLLLLSTSILMGNSIIALPDAFLFPIFCALLWASENRNFFLMGILTGLAGLSKWTAVFFVPAILEAIFNQSSPLKERIKQIFQVGILASVMQVPVIYWNAANHWITFKFHLADRYPPFNPSPLKVIERLGGFVGSQVLLLGLGFLVLCLLLLFKKKKINEPNISQPNNQMNLLYWILPSFIIVGISAVRGDLRFYWTGAALIVCVPLFANFCLKYLTIKTWNRVLGTTTVAQMLLLTTLLFFPVGEWVRPIVEIYREHDIRFSLRGDFEGWVELVDYLDTEKVIPKEKLGNEVAIVGSNFRVSSQMAWAARVEHPYNVYTSGDAENQFMLWRIHPTPLRAQTTKALLVADNRYPPNKRMKDFCDSPIEWKEFNYFLDGFIIKKIFWSICTTPTMPRS